MAAAETTISKMPPFVCRRTFSGTVSGRKASSQIGRRNITGKAANARAAESDWGGAASHRQLSKPPLIPQPKAQKGVESSSETFGLVLDLLQILVRVVEDIQHVVRVPVVLVDAGYHRLAMS